jgi:hypothetical protein
MDLWIQPCARCAVLYGKASAEPPHHDLTLEGIVPLRATKREEHYICTQCGAVFVRILGGTPSQQIWMLLNAGQH